MLKMRIITGAVLCIAGFLILLFSHIPWFISGVLLPGFCAQSVFELYRTTGAYKNKVLYYISCIAAVLLAFLDISQYGLFVCVVFIAAVVLFAFLMLRIKQMSSIGQPLATLLTIMVCFYKTMANIWEGNQVLYMLAIAVLACIITDVAAYCVGKGIGSHKLPRLSARRR